MSALVSVVGDEMGRQPAAAIAAHVHQQVEQPIRQPFGAHDCNRIALVGCADRPAVGVWFVGQIDIQDDGRRRGVNLRRGRCTNWRADGAGKPGGKDKQQNQYRSGENRHPPSGEFVHAAIVPQVAAGRIGQKVGIYAGS